MDLNLIAIAQQNPTNQFTFDQEAIDRAVLRQEERCLFLYALWSQCRAQIRLNCEFKRLLAKIATHKQSA